MDPIQLSEIIRGKRSTNMESGAAGISLEIKPPPLDPLILAVFTSCQLLQANKTCHFFFPVFIRGASQTSSLILILKQTKKQIFSPLYRHGDWGRRCPLLHPIPLESPPCHLSVSSSQFSSPRIPCFFVYSVFSFLSGVLLPFVSQTSLFLQHLVPHVLWKLPGPLLPAATPSSHHFLLCLLLRPWL